MKFSLEKNFDINSSFAAGESINAENRHIFVIAGPTASGKSSLAIELALLSGAEIISADSMQIYDEMKIGTARLDESEMRGVKHHLSGFVSPMADYTLADYVRDAEEIIENTDKPLIVCGGTGLYIHALISGMKFEECAFDQHKRNKYRELINKDNASLWYERMLSYDAEQAEKISVNDLYRLRRFFELRELTGENKSVHDKANIKGSKHNFSAFYLSPDRPRLYEKINKRCRSMFKNGLVEETAYLLKKYGSEIESKQSFSAIGYKESLKILRREKTVDEALEAFARSTRRYAKRQWTWFRHHDNMQEIKLSRPLNRDDAEMLAKELFKRFGRLF